VIADPSAWMFEGLNFRAGQVVGPDVIGPEFDRVFPGSSPKNIQVVAHSPVKVGARASFADTSYYSAPSGAGVFASASIWWLTKLSPPRIFAASPYIPEITEITLNVLRAFGTGPAGQTHPSRGSVPDAGGAGGPNANEAIA
jgi:N,N-dimethylformamidase beta subunit-like protein